MKGELHMKSRKKQILLLILALFVAMTAVGCQSGGEESGSTQDAGFRTPVPQPAELAGSIKLSTYYTAGYDVSAFSFIGDFNQQYQGVEIAEDSKMSYDEYFATLDERVANGTIGDVFVVDSDRLATYVEKGYVLDLTPYLDGLIEYTTGQYTKLIPSEQFFDAAYKSSLYKGKMYMVPTEYENKAVWLNIELLKQAGVNANDVPPEDDWTWDDLLKYAEALKEFGCENPIAMDYSDFSVWGAFAMSQGGELFKDGTTEGSTLLNLTDAKVAQGLEKFVDQYVRDGYIASKKPSEITSDELANYGIVILSHADLAKWEERLAQNDFEWDFAHFPRFSNGEEAFSLNIGVKTLGLAVRVREFNAEEEEDVAAAKMYNDVCAQLALYAMVPEAAEHFAGVYGVRVPALKAVNSARFWRDYPISGKNTSVFSLFNEYDYAANLTVHMSLDAAKEINQAMGSAIEACAKAGHGVHIDSYLQSIQDAANANWNN